jgi:hypothetical protein
MQNNLNRLALTFKRPIRGIHNRTNGIIFDCVECLIQRNLQYATSDIRKAYSIVKKTLYQDQYKKVVFILHSQGGIEGGLVLDWLLQELPQDLLSKLEVYTFGNAANHFNNPHRHVFSQSLSRRDPLAAISTSATSITGSTPVASPIMSPTQSNGHARSSFADRQDSSLSTVSRASSAAFDRPIGYIEHYAHDTDFVAQWGILHFAKGPQVPGVLPPFMGRLFVRQGYARGGHQFCQHYLDGMFPLAKHPTKKGEFLGAAEENPFMESVAAPGHGGDAARETMDVSLYGTSMDNRHVAPVEIHGFSKGRKRNRNFRVKELSRLWLYRNGMSPPPLGGVPKVSTV